MENEYRFTSKIDNSGRFVIPKRLLREINWDNTELVDVLVDKEDDCIVITKPADQRVNCWKCGHVLKDEFKYCPYCGKENKEYK